MEISLMSVFLACFTRFFNDENLGIRLVIFPIVANFIVAPVVYLAGYLLNRYYNTYKVYV